MSLFSTRKFFGTFKNETPEMKEILDLSDQLMADTFDALPVSMSEIMQGMMDSNYSENDIKTMTGLIKLMSQYKKLMNKSLEFSINEMKKRDNEIKELNEKLDKITDLLEKKEKTTK